MRSRWPLRPGGCAAPCRERIAVLCGRTRRSRARPRARAARVCSIRRFAAASWGRAAPRRRAWRSSRAWGASSVRDASDRPKASRHSPASRTPRHIRPMRGTCRACRIAWGRSRPRTDSRPRSGRRAMPGAFRPLCSPRSVRSAAAAYASVRPEPSVPSVPYAVVRAYHSFRPSRMPKRRLPPLRSILYAVSYIVFYCL